MIGDLVKQNFFQHLRHRWKDTDRAEMLGQARTWLFGDRCYNGCFPQRRESSSCDNGVEEVTEFRQDQRAQHFDKRDRYAVGPCGIGLYVVDFAVDFF